MGLQNTKARTTKESKNKTEHEVEIKEVNSKTKFTKIPVWISQ